MWHEQRKQERRIRGMMVDRRRRAERRRDYWERIRADPNQFLQIHGRSIKIHLDPSIAMAADSPATMMPWPGDQKIMIDRFDARANLDFIPEYNSKADKKAELSNEEAKEQRLTNYERFKILIQNEYLSVTEDKFLHTIELEEKYGGKTYQGKKAKDDKKLSSNKVAIGFKYEDSADPELNDAEEDEDSDLDSDEDFDLNLDVTSLDANQVHEINKIGHHFGLERKDVFKFFTKDYEEQEEIKANKAREAEKSSTKKSRRRRNKRLRSTEGYVSPTYALKKESSKSRSRSPSKSSDSESDIGEEKIEFITSFGGDSDQEKDKKGLDSSSEKDKKSKRKHGPKLKRSRSRDKRRSRSRSRRRRSRSRRSRSRSHDDWVRRRHSRRSRSRSKSRPARRSSRSISRERSRIKKLLSRSDSPPAPLLEKKLTKAYTPPPKPNIKLNLTGSGSSSDSSDSDTADNGGTR